MKKIFIAIVAVMMAVGAQAQYTKYVDPFVGTQGFGHTFPGACVPFGMIQASPVTGAVGWDYCSEYVGTDTTIWGFTQTHLNGTGCMDLGDILVMPTHAGEKVNNDATSYYSPFKKESETAHPGYYSVVLDKPQVKAEVSATPHVALYRFNFNDAKDAAVLLDFNHGPAWNEKQYHEQCKSCELNVEDDYTISGHVNNVVWVNQDYWFVIRFNQPIARTTYLKMARGEKGERVVLNFDMKSKQLECQVAMSSYSIDGARKNLQAEQTTFDEAVVNADKTWNSYFSRIVVDGSEEQLKNFYTSFYHALVQPNNIADVDGHFRDTKNHPRQMPQSGVYLSTFSCWDTYRAAHPFYTLFVPEIVDPIVNSMIEFAESEGHLPIWGLWGKDNYCMVANHACSVVAEAYHKGFRGFDAERAFNAIKMTQTKSHPLKSDWELYMRYGYFPTDSTSAESVSSTLENVYDDYAAWDMATLMGKTEDAEYFGKRKEFFKNLFDPETKFMRPRLSDGSWRTPFDPAGLAHAESTGGDYTEGNAWQYTWHVQHDVPALIQLMGGKKAFLDRLDTFFTTKLESTLADVTGLIGQYAHGNEPSHHVAYFYAMAGKPERTQELVREIFDTQYSPRPDGLCGNDDCGQMSAWYMLSAMGFYPVDPVGGKYIFGAPQMKHFKVTFPNGKVFEVEAKNLSKQNLHVAKILLNGKPYKKNYIAHEDIVKGGKLTFVMK
ncbi:MAG: GH92 family glycosyl hydrolase [Prevotellaceae bacterium]|nr:GH92 family glycosyl hydrolase [Prevotellaceae bacterium]